MQICEICHKGPVAGYNRPHSLHRTKRIVKPNIQKINGIYMCTTCLRTLKKQKKLGQ